MLVEEKTIPSLLRQRKQEPDPAPGNPWPENSVVVILGPFKDSIFDYGKMQGWQDVVVLEGRPHLKAARVSCQELLKRNIIPTVMADNMAGYLFSKKFVREIWLAYQWTDTEGVLCDTGSLILAVLGKRHQIPVNCFPGIERKEFLAEGKDLLSINGQRIGMKKVNAYVPLAEWVAKKYLSQIFKD